MYMALVLIILGAATNELYAFYLLFLISSVKFFQFLPEAILFTVDLEILNLFAISTALINLFTFSLQISLASSNIQFIQLYACYSPPFYSLL